MSDAARDHAIERALLTILAADAEQYPALLVATLRRDDRRLSAADVRRVLARLLRERRVARLWHRYMLREEVEPARRRWLDRLRARRDLLDRPGCGYREVHHALLTWDG